MFSIPFLWFPNVSHAALSDNLVSYWKLDETSFGSEVVTRNDSHGTNHLTDNGTTASGIGKINSGADFESANSESLSMADNVSLSVTGDFSISSWVKLESAPASDTSFAFVSKSIAEYHFDYENGAPWGLRLRLFLNSAGVSYPVDLGTGVWKHLVVTFLNSTKETKFYIDGGLVSTQTHTQSPTDGTKAFYISKSPDYTSYIDGITDETGLWSRVLTSTEVTSLYNGGAGLQYPFNGNSGTTNRLAKFITSTTVGDSLFSDDGSNITLTAGNLFMQIGSLIDTITGGALNFGTINATTMTFGRSGQYAIFNSNVGIATTSPLSLFSIGTAGNAFRVDTTGTVKEGKWNGAAIPVQYGGTGAGTLTGLLQGNGTSTITAITGTSGQIPYYNGTNTLIATSTISISTGSHVSIGTTTATEMLNLGNDDGKTNGTTTIKMGKIQFDGYNSAGVRTCMFIRGTMVVAVAGACK